VRGGGEYGSRGTGRQLTRKQNVFDDFAACMTFLVEAKYTRRNARVMGGSNGGLLMRSGIDANPLAMRGG